MTYYIFPKREDHVIWGVEVVEYVVGEYIRAIVRGSIKKSGSFGLCPPQGGLESPDMEQIWKWNFYPSPLPNLN